MRVHTSAQATVFLTGQNVELMGHPPYSLDLASNDFFLFPHTNKKIRGQRFSLLEDAVEAYQHVLEVSQSEWKRCFDKWFVRMLENTLKNNKTSFDDKYSHFHY